jgi:succinoglycan biosynthesis protein ExoV
MKLFYYNNFTQDRQNFGDVLNPWIWEQLLPGILDEDPTYTFVGIGTLINDGLPKRTPGAKHRIIFSTGVGYEKTGMPVIDDSYQIYCLRGPISAQKLGVSSDLAITDGALLIRKLIDLSPVGKKYKFSYMPHHNSLDCEWQDICEQLGFGYISPAEKREDIFTKIRQTEVMICEAMHGAIVSDALRTPWIPVTNHRSILSLKWQDWCASMQLEYQPYTLNFLHQPRPPKSGWDNLLTPVRQIRYSFRKKRALQELSQIAKTAKPCLSSDSRMQEMLNRLEGCLEQFKLDFAQGKFSV